MNHEDLRGFCKPPKRRPKTRTEHTVQGRYNGRWEDLTASDVRTEALIDLRAYRANEPETAFRVITRRVKIGAV
jgi:hypothetical protein